MDTAGRQGSVHMRRRKVRKQRRIENAWRLKAQRAATVVTAIAAAVYLGGIGMRLADLREQFGLLRLGSDAGEVRYQIGAPSQISANNTRWLYRNAERTLALTFDQGHSLIAVDCTPVVVKPDLCPSTGLIGLGSSEAQVRQSFGWNAVEQIHAGTKSLTFPGIGTTFRLARGQVQGISHTGGSGGFAEALAFAWLAMP